MCSFIARSVEASGLRCFCDRIRVLLVLAAIASLGSTDQNDERVVARVDGTIIEYSEIAVPDGAPLLRLQFQQRFGRSPETSSDWAVVAQMRSALETEPARSHQAYYSPRCGSPLGRQRSQR